MNRARVLVVEDESIVATDIAETLNQLGYTVVDTCFSGEEAVQACLRERPDVILMDIQLRGPVDGVEAVREIHQQWNIPVIYLTAYSDDTVLGRAKVTQPYGYITKPFNSRELHSSIEMALYKHGMEQRLSESEELLSTTLSSITDAVITADRDGTIRFLNSAACALLVAAEADLVGRPLDQVLMLRDPASKRPVEHPFARILESPEALQRFLFQPASPGEEIPVECSVSQSVDRYGTVGKVVLVLRDLTKQWQVEEMRLRLSAIVESSADAILAASLDGKILSWNTGAARIFGYEEAEVLGKSLSLLVPQYQLVEIPELLDRLRAGDAVRQHETVLRTKSGAAVEIALSVSPLRDAQGTLYAASLIARDITDRKKLEREVIEIGNRERVRLGQDLHDSLGQELTGISFKLKALEGRLAGTQDREAAELAEESRGLLKDAILHTRRLSRVLVPPVLQSEGLVGALGELAVYAESVYGCTAVFEQDPAMKPIDPGVSTQLYRIGQEAVTNACKHADLHRLQIALHQEGSEVTLKIADDGRGIAEPGGNGLGLRIMRYRASMIGGHLEIYSEESGGTTVVCRVPVPEERSAGGG
jgi:hypothetical protein